MSPIMNIELCASSLRKIGRYGKIAPNPAQTTKLAAQMMPSWTHFVFGRRSSLAPAESGAAGDMSCGAGADWFEAGVAASRMSSFGESMVSLGGAGRRRYGPPAAYPACRAGPAFGGPAAFLRA